MKKLQRHPLSALFSQYDLVDEKLDDLAADIKEFGIREPIKLYQGQVLDGWNRYTAAVRAKVEPVTINVGDDEPDFDPWAYVLSANVQRRHMTASDIAAVYLLKGQSEVKQPAGVPNGTVTKGKSVREVADELGVSRGTAERIKKVEQAEPEVRQAVINKEVSLDEGAKIAKLPKEQQAKAVKEPRVKGEAAPAPKTPDQQLMDDAFGDMDPMEELERVTNDYQQALRTIAALQTDDATKQIAQLSDTVTGLEARLADKMANIDSLNKQVAADTRILNQLCKLLNVEHPKKLVEAVKEVISQKDPTL